MSESIWTAAIIADLTRLWDEGHPVSEIARRLTAMGAHDFSRNAVIGKAHRLGLAPRPSPIKQRSAA
jgi:GcrA cell cycle regulator